MCPGWMTNGMGHSSGPSCCAAHVMKQGKECLAGRVTGFSLFRVLPFGSYSSDFRLVSRVQRFESSLSPQRRACETLAIAYHHAGMPMNETNYVYMLECISFRGMLSLYASMQSWRSVC